MPTLTQLEYIVTVERLKHFGKAAEACHVSQPSLSMQIQKVEEELGIIIFDRNKKPILPTDKGIRFIEQARVILKESHRLLEIVKRDKFEVSGDFRLGIIPTIAPYLLPFFIEDFSNKYPKVKLKIDELKTETIISELKDDALDGAILATPINEKMFSEKALFYEEFFLYINSGHPFAHRKRIKEEELDGHEMWFLQDGHCLRNQVIKICSLGKEKGVFKNISFVGGNLETLRYLIKRGKGYTLVPRLFAETLPESERKNLIKEFEHPAPSREISLIHRRDQLKLDVILALEEVIIRNLPKTLSLDFNKRKINVIGAN